MKCLQMFGLIINKREYFHQLEVVGRGNETQLQVGKNVNRDNPAT